ANNTHPPGGCQELSWLTPRIKAITHSGNGRQTGDAGGSGPDETSRAGGAARQDGPNDPARHGARARAGRSAEEALDLPDGVHEDIHLPGRVVEVEARARGGLEAQAAHERLGAVMASAQRDTALVGEGHDVVGVHIP